MGLTGAVHWWEESQMRVLVLSSLVIQFLLLIFSLVRRFAIPRWIRFIMWLAYLAGDAVAIYALATLFNRHKNQERGGSSRTLEVVWAPVLLLHLGGHDGITAYNIKDNELWSRHLVTAVSQVTVAIYVFCKSWPGGDDRLLQAAILLFVPGVLKCFAKPWALKSASINSLVSSSSASNRRTAKQDEGEMYRPVEEYVEQAKAFVREQKHQGEVRGARVPGDHPPSPQGTDINPTTQDRREHKKRQMTLRGEAYKLFVDLSSPYSLRLRIFKYFWLLSEERAEKAYLCVQKGLASAFVLLYTKQKTAGFLTETDFERGNPIGKMKLICRQYIQLSRMVLPWAAIGLFHKSHRESYNDIDVKITYALFCCTALLEAYSASPVAMAISYMESESNKQWPETVAQYGLIGYFARNRRHSKKMWIVSLFGCKKFLDQRWCMRPCFSSSRIAQLVLQYLKAGWKVKIHDAASYRRFNDNRGHWALEGNQDLGWSIKGPFDESVLLWHIATDFCFFLSPFSKHKCDFAKVPSIWSYLISELKVDTLVDKGTRSECGGLTAYKAILCRQLSNYMMYLLFVSPEMLLPGTRPNLFTTAYDELKDILDKPSLFATAYRELKDILKNNNQNVYRRVTAAFKELKDILRDNKRNPIGWSQWKPSPVTEEWLMKRVISTMLDKSEKASEEESNDVPKEEPMGGCKDNFVDGAWALAQGLLALGDDKMWEVIQSVWMEMLCFSASRCRGYLHAKSLGSGGEFLSYVWLLMSDMGMETFTERLQREELPSRREGDSSAASPASDARTSTASSTSMIHARARAAPSASQVHHTSTSPSTDDIRIDMSPQVALVEAISTCS